MSISENEISIPKTLLIGELAKIFHTTPAYIRKQLSNGTFPIRPIQLGGRGSKLLFREKDVAALLNPEGE